MAKKSSGKLLPNPYNETASSDPNSPDVSGAGLYVSYDEVMSAHLTEDGTSLQSTPNTNSGRGIMGGPAPGEPNPTSMPSEG
jgi:hypothetical protein